MDKELKNKLRSNLFRHLDGIVTAPTAYILHEKGVLKYIQKEKKVSLNKLIKVFEANEGYLNVGLRVLASQGWLEYEIVTENEIVISINKNSETAFSLIHLYEDVVTLLKLSGKYHRRKFEVEPFLFLEKIFKKYQQNYGVDFSENKDVRNIQEQILKHIEGIIVGPTVVSLGCSLAFFHWYEK